MTEIAAATPKAIASAAAALRRGALVAFPTETVYGLGADAENPVAMRALFAAKGRPADHPVIVHLAEAAEIAKWAVDIPPSAWDLARAFWPGPMTLVLRRSGRAGDLVTGGQTTIGLRVPGHPVAQALLRTFRGGIAAPSANRFGHVSPTRAEHVLAEKFDAVELILDGGPCQVGLESTIIDLSRGEHEVLRPGAVTREQIEAKLGRSTPATSDPSPRVSGSLASHYAPRARVQLVDSNTLSARAAALQSAGERVAILTQSDDEYPTVSLVIRLPQGEAALAQGLYAALREADGAGCDVILVPEPPDGGLSSAIADRLRKAAAPRP